METHGPLGTLWVSFGLIGFYLALIWLNTLLGIFLTPLFLIPQTWLMDKLKERKAAKTGSGTRECTHSMRCRKTVAKKPGPHGPSTRTSSPKS